MGVPWDYIWIWGGHGGLGTEKSLGPQKSQNDQNQDLTALGDFQPKFPVKCFEDMKIGDAIGH